MCRYLLFLQFEILNFSTRSNLAKKDYIKTITVTHEAFI